MVSDPAASILQTRNRTTESKLLVELKNARWDATRAETQMRVSGCQHWALWPWEALRSSWTSSWVCWSLGVLEGMVSLRASWICMSEGVSFRKLASLFLLQSNYKVFQSVFWSTYSPTHLFNGKFKLAIEYPFIRVEKHSLPPEMSVWMNLDKKYRSPFSFSLLWPWCLFLWGLN